MDSKIRWIRPRKVLVPLASRHRVSAITQQSRPKELNSIAMPWVDMIADTEGIRRGQAQPLPEDRWAINGRIYAREGNEAGRLYPESGDGIVILTRAQFKVLQILHRYNGDSDLVARECAFNPGITEADYETAFQLFRIGRGEEG